MKQAILHPLIAPVTKTISIPGSKSYTNRALLLASLIDKPVKILNPLFSDDTKAMIDSLKALGINIDVSNNAITVAGSIKDVINKEYNINTNLAATVIRFLLPLLCIVPGTKTIEGEEGLNKRPISHLVSVLRELGAKIDYLGNEGYPPLKIGSSHLNSGTIELDGGVSSQFFSSLFMIAPIIGGLTVRVKGQQISKPYIDMTIACMKEFAIEVINNNYFEYKIKSNQKYELDEYKVEGDFSSASYFFAIAALTKSTITIQNLNADSAQADKKILDVLSDMGNKITLGENEITIEGKGVKPVDVDMVNFPDQAQTLAVLATFVTGETLLKGLQSLHVKETDRLSATVEQLKKMHISTDSTFNSISIHGGDPKAAEINTYGDQRTAMSFAVAGSKIAGIVINDPDVVNKTFPGFWGTLEEIGMKVEINI